MAAVIRNPEAGTNLINPVTGRPYNEAAPSPLVNQYKLYNSGVAQNAADYDTINQGYKGVLSRSLNTPQLTPGTYRPQTFNYQPSSDYKNAVSNLQGLSQTGGYSGADIANLRERGISPIRAVYANAQRNLDRQRTLQGGYSPNYAAATAKMAREMSDQISGQVTNINAGLAERIAQNKLQVAPTLASTTQRADETAGQYGRANTDTLNDAQKFNITTPLQFSQANRGSSEDALRALSGMSSLYGTTPALAALFGNQAMQGAEFQNQITNQNANRGLQTIAQLISGLR